MLRSTFDKLAATLGALLALLLLIISGLAFWASSFANNTVSSQLKDQQITMPAESHIPKGQEDCLKKYADQPLDSGDKAKAYSDCYILEHMKASSGGKTYAEISDEQMAAVKKAPDAPETKKLTDLKQSLFQGNALRSMLLTAYAFGTMGKIALVGAITTLLGGILMGILSALGFMHAKKAGDAPLDHPHHTETVTTHAAPATHTTTQPVATETVTPAHTTTTEGPGATRA